MVDDGEIAAEMASVLRGIKGQLGAAASFRLRTLVDMVLLELDRLPFSASTPRSAQNAVVIEARPANHTKIAALCREIEALLSPNGPARIRVLVETLLLEVEISGNF